MYLKISKFTLKKQKQINYCLYLLLKYILESNDKFNFVY